MLIKYELLGKIINVILPFIFSFGLIYIIYPLYKFLNKYLPKILNIIIILLLLIIIISLSLSFIIPILKSQLVILIKQLINYLNLISIKYNIDSSNIINYLYNFIDYKNIITSLSNYITKFIIFIISFIYILLDIDRVECFLNKYSNTKIYHLLKIIDLNLKKYIISLLKISLISFFEYYIAFIIIKHNNPLLIGIVASITNLIPYIGGILVLIIGIITNPLNIIKISILYFILGLIDSYLINPYIYNKYNQINPLLELFFITILGYIFGVIGVIFSIPIIIIIITTIDFYKEEIIKYITKHFKNNLL